MFEKALKQKLRFPFRGQISCEDLWDLDVTQLNNIYCSIAKETNNTIIGLIEQTNVVENNNMLRLQIIKHVFNVKVEESKTAEKKMENIARKRRLLELIADKQDEELKNKSIDELTSLIDSLE